MWASLHGGNGGSLTEVILNTAEIITAVSVRGGGYIDQLTFTTNQRQLGPYGGTGGSVLTASSPPGGSWLRYVTGSSGGYLDNIMFWFA